jgi:hypothetical protein
MMRKGKIFSGLLVLAFGGSTLFPTLQAKCLSLISDKPYKHTSEMMIIDQSAENTNRQKKAEKESPFACNMLALDAEGRRRHIAVMGQMRAAIKETQELSDGYAFSFPSEQSTILLVAEFISRERLCCPFFTFELVAEREEGPLWLRLRGREGVKAFIRAELGIK